MSSGDDRRGLRQVAFPVRTHIVNRRLSRDSKTAECIEAAGMGSVGDFAITSPSQVSCLIAGLG